MYKFIVFIFIFLFSYNNIQAQTPQDIQKVEALNVYVTFTNESIHGLLIAHRLLENFNKNINKYVDLPDNIVNLYSNKDLPKDVFEDPEKWFYDISPNELFKKLEANKGQLPADLETQLMKSATSMKSITQSINNLRFEIDEMIPQLDLTKRENLSLVYDKLEEGVDHYKNFYQHQKELENNINTYYKTLKITAEALQFPKVLDEMNNVYFSTRVALDALYNKDDDEYGILIENQTKALKKLESINLQDYNSTRLINSKIQMYWNNVKKQNQASIGIQKNFVNFDEIPEEYKIYERFYYYYNIAVINKFNRYGNGIVFEMNRILDYLNIPVIKYFEMPHYFKVIYPKILESNDYIASSDPMIKSVPVAMRGREVKVANRVIFADSATVEFKMFDNKIIDGDIVTISFNGDWIVEKHKLTANPYIFNLALNQQGKNYLLLHADDVGRQPPCTIALSYKYKGKTENIFLNSDYNSSELIEIVIKE